MEAAEGSLERRVARAKLIDRAAEAKRAHKSFDWWCEHEDQSLIDAVSQRDMDAIFYLVWKSKRPLLGQL